MSEKVLLIVHQATSNPGRIGRMVELFGLQTEICRPACGDALPERAEDYAGVVIFGGPMSANDGPTMPFVQDEIDWISKPLAAGVPFLGVCLGAQMLAKNLGAPVGPSPEGYHEIGYYPVYGARSDCDLFADEQLFYQWHGEGFDLPHGAELLATGDRFPNQAYRYGNAYAIQFHPEVTREMMDRWTNVATHRMVMKGAQSRQCHLEGHARNDAKVEIWIRSFFAHWLNRPIPKELIAAE